MAEDRSRGWEMADKGEEDAKSRVRGVLGGATDDAWRTHTFKSAGDVYLFAMATLASSPSLAPHMRTCAWMGASGT